VTVTTLEIEKSVFVIHSRSDRLHESLYKRLFDSAEKLHIALYDYPDWQWDREGIPRYENHGTADQLDPVLWRVRDPHPFRHETRKPDEAALRQLWFDSRVVIVFEGDGRPSEGMISEMNCLERLYSGSLQDPPILVSVAFPHADSRYLQGLPIAFRFSALDVDHEEDVANRILALVLPSWLVHLLRSFGPAGYFVLGEAAVCNPIVRQVVETSPGHRTLDFHALEVESRIRAIHNPTQDTWPEAEVAEILDRIVTISNEWDRAATWDSTVSSAMFWLRSHPSEHELMEGACLVADRFEDDWVTAWWP
jgi:hypothetical protein